MPVNRFRQDTEKQVFYRPAFAGTPHLQHARAIHGAELNTFPESREG